MREFLGTSLNDCLSIKLGSSCGNAKKNWWLFWRRVCLVNWVLVFSGKAATPYRSFISVVQTQLILLCFSVKAKQVTFLAEDWSCLFLTESLCKQQLLIISEQVLPIAPSRLLIFMILRQHPEATCVCWLLVTWMTFSCVTLLGSHQKAIKDWCAQRGGKATPFPVSAIFHVEVWSKNLNFNLWSKDIAFRMHSSSLFPQKIVVRVREAGLNPRSVSPGYRIPARVYLVFATLLGNQSPREAGVSHPVLLMHVGCRIRAHYCT